jgi:hypothetical protein
MEEVDDEPMRLPDVHLAAGVGELPVPPVTETKV